VTSASPCSVRVYVPIGHDRLQVGPDVFFFGQARGTGDHTLTGGNNPAREETSSSETPRALHFRACPLCSTETKE
jgi:hypothetical protein